MTHHLFKGDAVGYSALHRWLREKHPKAGRCEKCGKEGPTDYAFQRHSEPYTRNRDDYREWCRSCHVQTHATRQTHCARGHELTPENVVEYSGRRWCKPCRTESHKRGNREYARRKRADARRGL